MRNIKFIAATILILSLILAGCSEKQDNKQDVPEKAEQINYEDMDFKDLPDDKKAERLKEREALETQRKTGMGEFYVPLPPLGLERTLNTVKAKALYLTANVAGFDFSEEDVAYYAEYVKAVSGQSGVPADASRLSEVNKLEKALGICESTEINALVIDIKNDNGLVAWSSNIDIVNQIKSNSKAPIKNYEKLMSYLKEKEIYTIARIVAFKDPFFAEMKSANAIQLKAGGVYKDYSGMAWVNPFDEYVWNYVVAISKEAALRGFDEIQYDYVRFPDDAKKYNPVTEFPGRDGRDKDEGIEDFLIFAEKELEPYNVHLSADVFGIITRSWDDKPEDIGQTWRKIADRVEYICPMIYPSHYGPGLYGFKVPDQYPYEVVKLALMEGIERNAAQKNPGIIRPWVQGFNATWVSGYINYDAKTISTQMIAGMELGIDEYIIWNASNNYDPMSFFYQDRINTKIREDGEDILARTPEITLKRYLDAEKNRVFSHLYLLTPITERVEDYDEFAAQKENDQTVIKKYEILNISKNEDGSYSANVNAEYSSSDGSVSATEAKFKIILENDVYKVIRKELN